MEILKKRINKPKRECLRFWSFRWSNPYGYYVGYVKNLKIWNYDRSETDIKENMDKTLTGQKEGLIAYTFHGGTKRSYSNHVDPSYKKTQKFCLLNQDLDESSCKRCHIDNNFCSVIITCCFQNAEPTNKISD